MTPVETKRVDQYVWHPFTQMEAWFEEDAPSIVNGQGCYLFDDQGRKYLDGISSLWCNVHGHRHPVLDEAVRRQLDKIAHTTLLGLASPLADELAFRLAAVTPPGLRWTFFSDSGSSAVEIALKIAFQYWKNKGQPKRTRFITLGDAYHGDTIGSVSLGGIDLFHRIFSPLLFESLRVPAPHCLRCPLELTHPECKLACAGMVEKLLEEHSTEVAAVCVEPLVQGAAGIITHPPGFLARLRTACDRRQTLLICDEVATGFGRTGRMFASEHEGVSPDLMCLAKGITGGYLPLAATLATDEIFDAFLGPVSDSKHFFHGHTYTANALASAAALANLRIFEKDNVIEGLAPKIEHLTTALQEAFADHPKVLEVRQCGLMVGIELAEDPATGALFDPKQRMGHQVTLEARSRGVILRPLGDVIVLMPPLAMTIEQLDELVGVAAASIVAATGK